jgi:23S rRNA (cytidine1920-2'-O)/16S rRNA (cytidine1409-2'-O)-methyltransferase
MPRRQRLDAELVRRGLARSRDHARDLIIAGRVSVAGMTASKPATSVGTDVALVVTDDPDDPGYASRGGHKLAGALDVFAPGGLDVAGRRALDAGASTGGFTDVLLRHGVREVVAVDVGYGQLAWSLRQDPRVVVLDRQNVRDLNVDILGGPVGLVVADLSFISLVTVLPALAAVATDDADLVLMVKPQFEVGKDRLEKGGVVKDPGLRTDAIETVARAAERIGFGCRDVCASPLPGPSGNIEYFVWLRRDAAPLDPDRARFVVAGGPQ